MSSSEAVEISTGTRLARGLIALVAEGIDAAIFARGRPGFVLVLARDTGVADGASLVGTVLAAAAREAGQSGT